MPLQWQAPGRRRKHRLHAPPGSLVSTLLAAVAFSFFRLFVGAFKVLLCLLPSLSLSSHPFIIWSTLPSLPRSPSRALCAPVLEAVCRLVQRAHMHTSIDTLSPLHLCNLGPRQDGRKSKAARRAQTSDHYHKSDYGRYRGGQQR